MNWVFAKRASLLGRWLPLLLAMGVIFFASHQPAVELPYFDFWDIGLKKGGHFLGYALLALLGMRAMLDWKRPYLVTLVFVLLYALSDEYHQTFIPGRNGTLVDVLIDMSGALSCLFLLHRWQLSQLPRNFL
jgi:VanZ family protein